MTLKLGITMLCHGVRESVDKEVYTFLWVDSTSQSSWRSSCRPALRVFCPSGDKFKDLLLAISVTNLSQSCPQAA